MVMRLINEIFPESWFESLTKNVRSGRSTPIISIENKFINPIVGLYLPKRIS